MADDQSTGALRAAIDDILKAAKPRKTIPALRGAEAYCRGIAKVDYAAALKRHFAPAELNEIFADVRKTLPTLNREIFSITDLARLAVIAEKMGVVLQARPFSGSDSAAFRGFYVNQAEVLKRPLIWVNTAGPPAAVAAAFWHEVGHHLTDRIWGTRNHPVSEALAANYHDQLDNPKEVAADLVRVLGGYPKPIAERLFGGPDMEASSHDADLLVSKATSHVRGVMGFDFQRRRSPKGDLYYLSGMIHTAKLRTTLLSEYGI